MWQFGHQLLALNFIPHGHCYLWKPTLVGLHLGSDMLTASAYFFVAVSVLLTRPRWKDLSKKTVFLLIGAFGVFFGCGLTHLFNGITLWYPIYWSSGTIKLLSALWSTYAFLFVLVPLIPFALDAPTPAQLEAANREIQFLNEKLKVENLRMSAELDVTRQLQQMILPKQSELDGVEGLDIAGFMEPADEVGGDYYEVLQHNGTVKIGIGDVTGHGLESGVLMLMVQTAVRTLQESNVTDPVKFLDSLNRTIYKNIDRMQADKNMTLALVDYHQGQLSLSGQHEEMIVVRASGEVKHIDTMDLGFPIGLDAEIADFISQEKVRLDSQDVAILYTDGITEAEDINGVQYGLEKLCEVVKAHRHLSAAEIKDVAIQDVRSHIGKQKVFDDITLLVLKQRDISKKPS